MKAIILCFCFVLQEDSLATDNFLVDYFNEFLSLPVSVLLCSIEYIINTKYCNHWVIL